MSRIYISGGITGVPDCCQNFKRVEDILMSAGYAVVNPERLGREMPFDMTYEDFMTFSFALIDLCDSICMLDGWKKSKGANREYGYAVGKGMAVIKESDINKDED